MIAKLTRSYQALEVAMGVAHCERVFLFLICKRIQILSVHNLEHPGPIIHGDLRSVRL